MCDCINKLDEDLKPHNTQLCITWNYVTGATKVSIRTEQLETGRGKKKAVGVSANYCPFCGEEYQDGTKEAKP